VHGAVNGTIACDSDPRNLRVLRVPVLISLRALPGLRVLLTLGICLLALTVSADTRLRVELTDTGDCSVTTNGPSGRSHVRYPRSTADWRCAVTTVADAGVVELEVVAPPGADRPASSFPQLAWHEEAGRWIGRARLPSPPAFVRLAPSGSRERWLDGAALAAAALATLWSLGVARGRA
jgi:hypothetical protein